MSRYSLLLSQVNFPHSSEEYSHLVLSMVELHENEAIRENISKKPTNMKFKDLVLATIEFLPKLPKSMEDFPGFVLGLLVYIGKLNKYSTWELPQNEAMIVSYAALMYRDSAYRDWPSKEEICQRIPVELTDTEFAQACESLSKFKCIRDENGKIEVIESIDILDN